MCDFEDWKASNGHTKDTTRLFHGPWHNLVGEHICARHLICGSVFIRFGMFHKYLNKRKSDANKQDFEMKITLTLKTMFNQSSTQ